MKIYDMAEEYLEDDVIDKIYHNDFYGAEKQPQTLEYKRILKQVREKEKRLMQMFEVHEFYEYLELRNVKESIEVEEQFKLGFKTAIRIILESYH